MASSSPIVQPRPVASTKDFSFTVVVNKKLVSLLGTFKKLNIVTTYAEVLDGLRLYIAEKRLFDPTKPSRICCLGDELSSVLGVEEFTIADVRKLIQKLVFPVRFTKTVNSAPVMPAPDNSKDSSAVKRKAEEGEDEGTAVKKTCDEIPKEPMYLYIPPSPVKAGSSSDTAESIQGYETAFVKDSSDESLSFFESDNELQPGDILAVEETFDVEYDVESDESDLKSIYRDSDSEDDYDTVITFVCKSDSDQEFWADKSSDEEYNADLEIPESDKWKCKRCGSHNNPPMRYCIKCWTMRAGWVLPKRSEQRDLPRRKLRKRKMKKIEKALNTLKKESVNCPPSPISTSSINSAESKPENSSENFSIISACEMEKQNIFSNYSSDSKEFLLFSPSSSQELPCSSTSSSQYISEASCSSQEFSMFSCSSSQEYASSSGVSSLSSNDSNDVLKSLLTLNLSAIPYNDSKVKLCMLCCSSPANASIVHGKYAHQISCYRCAKKLQYEKKRCPVCRRTIDRVVHQITAV